MHKLVYKMYMDKIEDMEKDKDEMQRLTEMLNNPENEFPEEENEVSILVCWNVQRVQILKTYANLHASCTFIVRLTTFGVLLYTIDKSTLLAKVYSIMYAFWSTILYTQYVSLFFRKWRKKGRRRSWLKTKSKVQSLMSQWRANQISVSQISFSFSLILVSLFIYCPTCDCVTTKKLPYLTTW